MKLVFELVVADVNLSAELEKQRKLVKDLNKEFLGTDAGSEKFDELAKKLAEAKLKTLDLTARQKELNAQFKATQVPTDSLAGLRLEYSKLVVEISKLSKAERESDTGKALISSAGRIKKEINSMQESVGNFVGSVGNYQKALLSTFDLVSAGLLTGGIERGIDLIADTVIKGVSAFAAFEKSLDNLSALTGVTGNDLENFRKKAEGLTNIKIGDQQIVNSVTNIVEAFKIVGGAQPELLKDADALAEVTKQAIVLSEASGLTLKDAVESVTTGLGQFQLGAEDSAVIINELAAGAKEGASEISDTTVALKEFGTVAASNNVKTAESVALIELLAERQLKGAEAGTQLRNILAKLASADVLPRTALAELKEAGVDIDILRDKSLPLEARLAELGKLAGNTTALVKTFGLENLTAAQIITDGTGKYKELLTAVQGTSEAYKQAEINAGNLSTEYKNLKEQGLNLLISGFETIKPLLYGVLLLFNTGIKFIVGFVSAIATLPKFIKDNEAAFVGLITGLTILNSELIFASANSIRLAIAEKGRAAVTYLVTGAQTLLNAAMRANPIGLIITAVSALVIGFKALYDSSENVRASISGLSALAKEVFSIIGESVTGFIEGFKKLTDGDLQGALSDFGKAFIKFNPIGTAFTQGQRLRDAFNNGYNDKLASDQREKAEQERDDRQVSREGQKAKKVKDLNLDLSAALDRDAAKKEKNREQAIKDQTNRIDELRKSIKELDAQTILNEFDKQSIEIENRRAESIKKLADQRGELTKKIKDQNGVITTADQEELNLISEQTASITAAYKQQQEQVEAARQKAIDKQSRELATLSIELQSLAADNARKLAEVESEITNADFTRQQAELVAVLNARKLELTKQLADQSITQEVFKKEYLKAQEAFNVGSLKLEQERAEKIKQTAVAMEQARITAANAAFKTRVFAIDAEASAEVARLAELQKTSGVDNSSQIEATRQRAAEQRRAAEIDYNKEVGDAANDRKQAEIDALNAINATDEQVHQDKLRRLEDEEEKRKRIREAVIDSAKTIAGAVFEIERNRTARQLEEQVAALDAEFAAKREAAQGNQVQLEQLDKDYQKKKEQIEKEAAEKRKKTAITEAIIQGALAVVKSLPNLVLAAVTAVATAAQVAVISSQKFATGGSLKFGRFGGKPHSAGGTKGAFDDGTQVEVEEDEVFIVLNRKASRAIKDLSDFNFAHGGRKFATGGSLDFTPQISQSRESGTIIVATTAAFTDEQIKQIAFEIANETATKTQRAVVAGLDDRNRTAEREIILQQNSQV